MLNDDKERLTALEIKATYLEDILASLNETLLKQGEDIEALRFENRLLREKLLEALADQNRAHDNQRPPHY